MGAFPVVVLKASLWTQAALLLVMTSILADTDAWIGMILTTAGLCFVVIGILAAYMQRFGFLYIYATLVGIWEISALAHILLICGLASLPPSVVDISKLVGNRVSSNSSDPLRIVLPLLYGIQWIFWCISLISLTSLRPEMLDPTRGFDIQEPAYVYPRPTAVAPHHSHCRRHCTKDRNTAVIDVPHGRDPSFTTLRFEENLDEENNGFPTTNMKGKEIANRHLPNNNTSGALPGRSDSGAIVIPKDPRISQVLVRLNHLDAKTTPSPQPEKPRTSNQDLDPASTYTQSPQGSTNRHTMPKQPSNRAHFVLNVPAQGESLSEMILKVSESGQAPLMHNHTPTTGPINNMTALLNEHPSSNGRNNSNETHSLPTDIPNPARVKSTSTKASLTLSSDSSLSGLSVISNESSFECDEVDHSGIPIEDTTSRVNQGDHRQGSGKLTAEVLPELDNEDYSLQTASPKPDFVYQGSNEVTQFRREALVQAPLWKPRMKNNNDDGQGLVSESILSSAEGNVSSNDVDSMSEPCPRIQPNSPHLGQPNPTSNPTSNMDTESHAPPTPEEEAIAFTMETNEPSTHPAAVSIQYLMMTPSTSTVASAPHPSAARAEPGPTSTLDTQAPTTSTPTSLASTSTASIASPPTTALSASTPPPSYGHTPVIARLQQTGIFDTLPGRPYTPASSSTNRALYRQESKPTFHPPSPIQAYHQRLENDPYISHRLKGPFRVMSSRNSSSPSELPLSPTAALTPTSASTISPPLASIPTPTQPVEPENDPPVLAITESEQGVAVPMIVIHPDPDDEKEGEPPRVLSDEEIEYLSMMPPPPLRLLEQPWDDSLEDEEYVDDMEEAYGDEDFEDIFVRNRIVYDIEEEEMDREDSDDDQIMLVSMEMDGRNRGHRIIEDEA